jgi:NADH:ubiquinone oxidoreductase subunit B-like Fe-S oxidoreductase
MVIIIPFVLDTEDSMRKMIMMAIAGYLLKKMQANMMKQTYRGNPVRRT